MKVVGIGLIDEFGHRHADSRAQLAAWLQETIEAEWRTPSDIKARYRSASFLTDNRVVFNIKGNKYRLDVKIAYNLQIVKIIRIGTHADYDRWDF